MAGSAPRRRAARTAAIAAVVLSGLLLGGCAGSSASGPTGGRFGRTSAAPRAVAPVGVTATVAKVFVPFGPDGVPAAGVAARRSGSCFTSSVTVPEARAYRCFARNQILDPCFAASTSARSLACFAAPWSKATVLRLTAPLPAAHPLGITRPWALELAGGDRCVAITGTTELVRGVALGYRCLGGQAGLRTGSSALAHALFAPTNGTVRDITVVAEWEG